MKDSMNVEHSFLIEQLEKSEYTNEEIELILKGLSCQKLTTLRVNTLKDDANNIKDTLTKLGISFKENKNFPQALILNDYYQKDGFDSSTGLRITTFSFYKEGHIYLQSLSSMLPVLALDPKPSENILDMCAAPGSKTTMIQSVCNNKANLTAVELHKDRFEKLKYNCNLQNANALLFNMNALDLDNMFKFDKILLDAPCSGSGTLDISNNRYKKNFAEELINKCVSTQKKLIKKSSKLLKSGGKLIYSTCSLLKSENEDIVDYALENGFEIDFCNINIKDSKFSAGSSVNENVYIKIFPDEIWEGFFVAKLHKK